MKLKRFFFVKARMKFKKNNPFLRHRRFKIHSLLHIHSNLEKEGVVF